MTTPDTIHHEIARYERTIAEAQIEIVARHALLRLHALADEAERRLATERHRQTTDPPTLETPEGYIRFAYRLARWRR